MVGGGGGWFVWLGVCFSGWWLLGVWVCLFGWWVFVVCWWWCGGVGLWVWGFVVGLGVVTGIVLEGFKL